MFLSKMGIAVLWSRGGGEKESKEKIKLKKTQENKKEKIEKEKKTQERKHGTAFCCAEQGLKNSFINMSPCVAFVLPLTLHTVRRDYEQQALA